MKPVRGPTVRGRFIKLYRSNAMHARDNAALLLCCFSFFFLLLFIPERTLFLTRFIWWTSESFFQKFLFLINLLLSYKYSNYFKWYLNLCFKSGNFWNSWKFWIAWNFRKSWTFEKSINCDISYNMCRFNNNESLTLSNILDSQNFRCI